MDHEPVLDTVSFPVFLAAVVVAFYLVEAPRPVPKPPEKFTWAPDIPIKYVDIRGIKIRYIKTGAGPNLVGGVDRRAYRLPHRCR